VVEFQSYSRDTREDKTEDAVLAKWIGKGHEHVFRDQRMKPAWEVTVLMQQSSHTNWTIDVIFRGHHSLFDGMSGANFQKTLHKFLNQGSNLESFGLDEEWPVIIPSTIELPFIIDVKKWKTVPWTPYPATQPPAEDYVSRARLVTIPYEHVQNILKYCRRLNTTVTGFLHSLLTIFSSRNSKKTSGIRATTPFSLRGLTKLSVDELAMHVLWMKTLWPKSLVEPIRLAAEDSQEEELLVQIARHFHAEIDAELKRIPAGGGCAMIDLFKPARAFGNEQIKMDYELSNIGVVKMLGNESPNCHLKLEKLAFTQCGMMDTDVGCSVATILGGPMVICLTWVGGAVEEQYIEKLSGYLEKKLIAIG